MATESEIKQMKRGELNALAVEYGMNPDDYSRADDLRSAIFEHLSAQEEAAPAKTEETEAAEETAEPEEAESKGPKPNPPKPRIERRSKRYRDAHSKVDKTKEYELAEAIKLVKSTSTVSFDAAVELHVNLGVDPKQSDQLIRGSIVLPHGSGKSQRVVALVPDEMAAEAKKAGADDAGAESVLAKLEKGETDFDILVAHPSMMKDLGKFAKTLGPQGLMPSPKAGTVTEDIAKTVSELKAGRVEYRVDRYGIIHQAVGRVSFDDKKLTENIEALMGAIKGAKPSSSKGVYLKRITLTSSMGPGLRIASSAF